MNELLEEKMKRVEEYVEIGRAAFEEEAQLSMSEADGSSEVYFVQESSVGAIKVGITSNLDKRIGQLRTGTPHEVEILGSIHADGRLERYVKRRFAYARIRGEWFRPVEELSEYIDKITGFEIAPRELPKP